ncbi:MAG: PCRF domain-containing protein, partial [Desulfomonilia bacterium]
MHKGIFEIPRKRERLEELEAQLADPAVWKDPEKSREIQSERSRITDILENWKSVSSLWEDLQVLLDLAREDEQAVSADIKETISRLMKRLNTIEKAHILSGREDPNSAFLEIHAGAGGLEAQDWAEMLLRMYLRWAEKEGFKTRIIDILSDEAAGIKSATIEVEGQWAFGYLKGETGVHRLVRISPFDANSRRHTSFASVMVTPEVDMSVDVKIDEKDLRI